MNGGLVLVEARQEIPRSSVIELLDTVRNRVHIDPSALHLARACRLFTWTATPQGFVGPVA